MRLAAQIRESAAEVRSELAVAHRVHGQSIPDLKLYKLVLICHGNAGLAADALCMWPRPGWVEATLGPYPPNLELANPDDVASVEEWGALG